MSALNRTGFEGVPTFLPNVSDWCQKIALRVNQILQGKINVTYDITFTPSASSTMVQLPAGRLGSSSFVAFMPLTANAASASGYYVSNLNSDTSTITITHANTATTDRNFRLLIIG